jgi:hypothetical protein
MNTVQPVTMRPTQTLTLDEILARQGAKFEMPVKINQHDYAEAVTKLVNLAQLDCGGSKSAAQVVLSLYNGRSWHVNLIDLCSLDCAHFRAAIIAIRGRVEFNREPHEMIRNGDEVFDRLQDYWGHLHTKNRYKNF